ncbi:MAG: hypothetical protein KDB14_01705, partial [Planctomycetales bacterium]|nr:hypothetical protein [Planctomycetales bacterium]
LARAALCNLFAPAEAPFARSMGVLARAERRNTIAPADIVGAMRQLAAHGRGRPCYGRSMRLLVAHGRGCPCRAKDKDQAGHAAAQWRANFH